MQEIRSISTSADDLYLSISVLSSNRPMLNDDQAQDALDGLAMGENENKKIACDLYLFNKAVVDAVKSVHKDPFEPIFEKGAHSCVIKKIAICPSKTLLVSLSEDNTLKVWEFGNDHREVFSIFFHDNPTSVAFHPLSIYIALGFHEG